MAEARSIAHVGANRRGVHLATDEDGLHVNFSFTVPSWPLFMKRIGRRWHHLQNFLSYQMYPLGPVAVACLSIALAASVVLVDHDSWLRSGWIAHLVWDISTYFPWHESTPKHLRIALLAFETGFVVMLILAYLQRTLLRALLRSKAFLYAPRKGIPLSLKLWFMVVKALVGTKPLMMSYQSVLPPMPVPKLEDTVRRYLDSVEPWQEPAVFEKTKAEAAEFLAKTGPNLQWYLKLKWWTSKNYVTDWWEKYVYLRGRDAIMVNSNYYVLDSAGPLYTNRQCARAANLVVEFAKYKEQLETEQIPPLKAAGVVPLCMWQFERMFNTSRVPGMEADEIRHWPEAKHVAVYCNGSFYRVSLFKRDGYMISPQELETQLEEIWDDAHARTPSDAQRHLPALTAANRTHWADTREKYLSTGLNRESLHVVESALVFLVLDEEKAGDDWTNWGHSLIHGKTYDRWFDKSVTFVVFRDARCGINAEHSWADAPVVAHMMECTMLTTEMDGTRYAADGKCSKGPRTKTPVSSWRRLKWDLEDAAPAIERALTDATALANDLDLLVVPHTAYGKGFMKTCKVSPDAYVQMAMQLAYYRDVGRFNLTYEASMTRLFLHGRTETVRPVTSAAVTFVKLMQDEAAPAKDKLKALQAAAERHQQGYRDAMAGKGIDRHLFALYVVSVGKEVDSPFLQHAIREPWRLSTSQQPQQQTDRWDVRKPEHEARLSPGGGFGPVADDGYGVSYMVAGEKRLFFHISSKKSSPITNSARFRDNIFKALADMRTVFEAAAKE
jgi:carnitine O-palmitoyltransferase 1